MRLLKMNQKEKVQEAKAKSQKAVIVFQDTLKELMTANDILLEVIEDEKKQIQEHEVNIETAGNSIMSNKYVIDKLKEFIPS